MAETIMIPWYATGLRADRFAQALEEIAVVALRYGATEYAVYRSLEDRYRFNQLCTFRSHLDFERYWEGREMIGFRTRYSGWYQVPVLYQPWERIAFGRLALEEADLAKG